MGDFEPIASNGENKIRYDENRRTCRLRLLRTLVKATSETKIKALHAVRWSTSLVLQVRLLFVFRQRSIWSKLPGHDEALSSVRRKAGQLPRPRETWTSSERSNLHPLLASDKSLRLAEEGRERNMGDFEPIANNGENKIRYDIEHGPVLCFQDHAHQGHHYEI